MKDEAEANAEADKKAKEEVDKLNAADALIFSTEKQLKEYGDKISADKKTPIETGLKKLQDAFAAKNLEEMETAQTELQEAWNAASEEMYKATQEAGAQGAPSEGPVDNSDQVTDVDFEEVKDDDKK
jgi:molecular chaperone DnaK